MGYFILIKGKLHSTSRSKDYGRACPQFFAEQHELTRGFYLTTQAITTYIYKFRFDNSDEHVYLTQQQIDRIPYLSALVANKNDFSSIPNQNGEYILKPPINYTSFMVILHSVTSEQPYILFHELSEDENILEILQLIYYLHMNSFPTPCLRDKYSFLSSHFVNYFGPSHAKYHQVKNISEARDTAAEFIIARSDKTHD
ncbi:unnamed protein product [Rotaria sp. Silwood1]|nr:unnamed protein product [Rotaria sp. Silwood1]